MACMMAENVVHGLGQEPKPRLPLSKRDEPPPANRILETKLYPLLRRHAYASTRGLPGPPRRGGGPFVYRHEPAYPHENDLRLVEVSKSPTAAEIKELSFIDWMFHGEPYKFTHRGKTTWQGARAVCKPPIPPPVGSETRMQRIIRESTPPPTPTPFFCPPLPQEKAPVSLRLYTTGVKDPNWTVDVTAKWADEKTRVLNIGRIAQTLAFYPWPSPPEVNQFFRLMFKDAMNQIAAVKAPLHPEDIRTWLTLTLMDKFDELMTAVERHLKRKAEKLKRRALVRQLIVVALATIFTLGIGSAAGATAGAIVGTGFKTVIKGLDTIQKVKAAKSLEKAAAQFDATDAAFAAEIRRVSALFDAPAAAAEAVAPPLPEETAAVAEVVAEETVQNQGAQVVVEGQVVTQTNNLDEAAQAAVQNSVPGDRVEVIVGGKPTGLNIRTQGGMESVPPQHEPAVRAASHEQLQDLARQEAAARPGRFPWWLIPVGAAAAYFAL